MPVTCYHLKSFSIIIDDGNKDITQKNMFRHKHACSCIIRLEIRHGHAGSCMISPEIRHDHAYSCMIMPNVRPAYA